MGKKIVRQEDAKADKKKRSWVPFVLKVFYWSVCAFAVIVLMSLAYDMFKLRGILNSSQSDSEESASSSPAIMEVSEMLAYVDESHINERVTLVGFMCDETGEEVGACWITDKTFTSIDDTTDRIRVRRDEIIQYTPYAVVVSGRLFYDEAEKEWGVYNSSIYTYDGSIERYSTANEVLRTGVLEVMMGMFANGEYSKDALENASTALGDIAQDELIYLLDHVKNCVDAGADDEEMDAYYNEFVSIMKGL